MSKTQRRKMTTKTGQGADRRAAERHKLVLRVGLLEQDGRMIFCLVKNISAAGVQVKPYGRVSQKTCVALRVGDEDPIVGAVVWSRDGLAGIDFDEPLNPQAMLRIGQKMVTHRRRTAPRVTTDLRACVRTGGVKHSATVCDLSMIGARLRTVQPISFGDTTIIEIPGLPSLSAHLRWSDRSEYGVSFQTPLPMQIIADLLSREQPPPIC